MSQKEAIAIIYDLARKSIEDPSKSVLAVRRIAGIVEKNFMEKKRA